MKTQVCTKCGQTKFLFQFKKAETGKNGVRGDCSVCTNRVQNIRRKVRLTTDKAYREKMRLLDKNRWCGIRREKALLQARGRTSDEKKDAVIKSIYGITMKDFYQMLAKQKGICLICGDRETRKDSYTGKPCRLHIDHDHKTGKVRGLLCHKCNNGLGQFRDRVDLLEKAKQYLLGGN